MRGEKDERPRLAVETSTRMPKQTRELGRSEKTKPEKKKPNPGKRTNQKYRTTFFGAHRLEEVAKSYDNHQWSADFKLPFGQGRKKKRRKN